MNTVLTLIRVGERDLGALCWGTSPNLKRLIESFSEEGEGHAKFQLQVSENKNVLVFFFHIHSEFY